MMIEGKRVVITGAAGGIGAALVAEFLAAGAGQVIACDLDGVRLDQAIASSERVVNRPLDVTDEAAVAELADEFSAVDIVVNCHGVVIHEGYLEADDIVAIRREMDINYWGQVLMCRAFARIVNANSGGAIVNVLSPLAYVTFPFAAAYCATKAACRVLTEALRAELGPQGTLVMGVYPGNIDTAMMKNLQVPKSSPAIVAKAVVQAVRTGETEIWAGEGAAEMKEALDSDATELISYAHSILTSADINQPRD